jgi:hypothetical protein
MISKGLPSASVAGAKPRAAGCKRAVSGRLAAASDELRQRRDKRLAGDAQTAAETEQKTSARLQHPICFGKRPGFVREKHDAYSDGSQPGIPTQSSR